MSAAALDSAHTVEAAEAELADAFIARWNGTAMAERATLAKDRLSKS